MSSSKPMPITDELAAWIKVVPAERIGIMIRLLVRHWEGEDVVPDRDMDASFREVLSIFIWQLDRIKNGGVIHA